MPQKRFTQKAYSTLFFTEKIFVKCPKCESAAIVRVKREERYNYCSSLHCFNCGFYSKSGWFGRFQGCVNLHCGFCGTKIIHKTPPTNKPFKEIALKCNRCQVKKIYPLKWYRYCKGAVEPYFGLELWLRVDVRDSILWAYNERHLAYLKEYISSTLREDDNRNKYSIISNLPKWMKSSKNRDLIIKKIEKLEKIIPNF